jgi:hypothetical protein
LLSSIPANPGLIAAVMRVLSFVDDLPPGATGVLRFGDQGLVLLQARKVCWAVARTMRVRLTDIIRNQSTPPLPREAVEAIYRRCRENNTPIGEALVASGLASEAGLRAALFKHNQEAIVALARGGLAPDAFTSHSKTGYDPKFSFSSCEVLAMLGSADDPASATAAQHELGDVLVPDSTGVAFTRSSAASGVMLIAVDRACDVPVRDLLELCSWVAGLFDVARTFDPGVLVARVAWGPRISLVSWRVKDVDYVGLCSSRAAAARLVSRLAARGTRTSGVLPVVGPSQGSSA